MSPPRSGDAAAAAGPAGRAASPAAGWALKLGLTCTAAMAAEAATYPIDLVKTRLQLQGELGGGALPPRPPSTAATAAAAATSAAAPAPTPSSASAPSAATAATASAGSPGAAAAAPPHGRPAAPPGPQRLGAVRLAAELVRREGLRGLYAGLAPALVRHIFYTGTRITVYEQLRAAVQAQPARAGAEAAGAAQGSAAVGLATKLALGLTAGAVGQAVAVPADLVKVRLQAEGRLVAAGKLAAPRYRGMRDCLRQALAAGGMAGLWRGGAPAVQRAALVNLGELATYDQAKQAVLASGLTGGADNPATHAAAALASGFFASVASVPADVVKTRMMSQDPAAPRYRSSLDCLLRTVRAEGPLALYKGFFPTWARLGPWQLVFWSTYEASRRACDLGGF